MPPDASVGDLEISCSGGRVLGAQSRHPETARFGTPAWRTNEVDVTDAVGELTRVSWGDRTSIELFLAGITGLDIGLRQSMADGKCASK